MASVWVWKKIWMLSVLKLSLSLNNLSIDLTNLPEANWDEMTAEQILDINKFDIDVTDDDINQCREVLSAILYFADYCCIAVFKKMKCNICKNLISERDIVGEIHEINSIFFRGLIEVLSFILKILLQIPFSIIISKVTKIFFFSLFNN